MNFKINILELVSEYILRSMLGVLSKSNFQLGENNFEVIVIKNDDDENESYFVAKRVAEALGFVNTNDAAINYCLNRIGYETLMARLATGDPLGIHPHTNLIPENDVYRLVLGSKLPQAIEFQDFVCDKVLKSIRKYGCYPPPGKIPSFPKHNNSIT